MSVRKKLVVVAEGIHAPSDRESTSEEEEWFERGDHPLVNDLVLGTLFRFAKRFDLKACRVVSKKWNLHTIPHMRATFKVTIRGSQSTEQNDNEGNEDTRRIQDFVKLFKSNELGIPFAKFQLRPFRMTDGAGKQFLQLCGEIATEIGLIGGKEQSWSDSEVYTIEDVSELLASSPNIQVLTLPNNLTSRSETVVKLFPDSIPTFPYLKKITFRADREKKGLKFCPTLVDELFTATLNVSDIVVHDTYREGGSGEETVIGVGAVLNAIEKLGLESAIQSIYLDEARTEHIEQLRRMGEKENGLKLKSLCLNGLSFTRYDINAIQLQLASYFKDTLQDLSVSQGANNHLMEFPYMAYLKTLTFSTMPDLNPKPVNLNKKFPVLETFKLSQYGSEIPTRFLSKFESCPTVKSFHLSTSKMTINTFHEIMRVFPSLTKFNLSLRVRDRDNGVAILKEIWTQMTGLESLTIYVYIESTESLELDSLFTGISIQTLKELTQVVNDLDKMTVEKRRETILLVRDEHSRLPSIGNLTKLKYLDLNVSGGVNWIREIYLTDLTAYLAFYSMSQLMHLNVKGCLFTKMSCEILRKEKGLDTWYFRNSEGNHTIPSFVLPEREKDYN